MATHHRRGFRHLLVVAATLVASIAVIGLAPSTAQAADRAQIVTVANNQLNDDTHNHEIGGYNCNFFTSYFGAGSTGCSNGWRTEAWCADFARYTWARSGVAYTSAVRRSIVVDPYATRIDRPTAMPIIRATVTVADAIPK